jgi:uncharacterized protein (DUF2267 family)
MSATGLDVFDRTVQKSNSWLKSLMDELDWEDRHRAYSAMRVTLHALRDRLTVEEVAQMGAQLPMLIRGFYYEAWDPTAKPLKLRHREEFLERIAQYFVKAGNPVHPEPVARAVFTVLARRISDGEIEDVKHILPEELRSLWP